MSTDSISSAITSPHYSAVAGVWEKKSNPIIPPSIVTKVVAHVEIHQPLCVSTVPPPYIPHDGKLDGRSADEEPSTPAHMLFVYGFVFFPFWLAGICILWSPLLPTPDWEAGKTEHEKAYQLHVLRVVELTWARRCLYALLSLLVTTFVLFLVIKYAII